MPRLIPSAHKVVPIRGAQPLQKSNSAHVPRGESVRSILVCTDFSPAADAAFEEGVRLARLVGAKLAVLHVTSVAAAVEDHRDRRRAHGEDTSIAHTYLAIFLERLRLCFPGATVIRREGHVAGEIVREAANGQYDLVLMGTHNDNKFKSLPLGSTAEQVIRECPCPVLTMSPASLHEKRASSRPVIVSVDFDQHAPGALEFAADLAEREGSPLHCIHVAPFSLRESDFAFRNILHRGLRAFASGIAPRCALTCRVLFGNDVSQELVTYARAMDAGTMILGVQRRPQLIGDLPPDRVYRIIMTSPCPVLTRLHPPPVHAPPMI